MAFDLQGALTYDKKQPYGTSEIETIQRVTGSAPSGAWDPATVQAIADWQAKVGLDADGKVGRGTWAAIQRVAATQAIRGSEAKPPKLGVWLDDQPATVLGAGWLANLRTLGFSTIAVMVQRSTSGSSSAAPWSLRWTAAQLAQLRELAQPLGFDITLTTWPLPDPSQLATFAKEMPALMSAAGASGLEVDTEGNWLASRVHGFSSLSDAAKALVDTLRSSAAVTKARLELTTYPFHGECSTKAEVTPHVDLLLPQAYSVANRSGKAIAWDDPQLGPGGMQAAAVHRAEAVPGITKAKPLLGLGLAGYDQRFAGHEVAQALQVALDAATLQHIPEVRYWSSRWVFGSSSNRQPEVAAFFAAQAKLASVPSGGGGGHGAEDPESDAIEAERAG